MLKKLMVFVLCLSLFIVSGCTSNSPTKPNDQQQPKPDLVMKDFHALLQKDAGVEDIAQFISDNISYVTKENASEMVIKFEKLQREKLPQYEAMFTEGDNQIKIANGYESIPSGTIKDPGLKELVQKTYNSGYKIETAEGTFFPILNYQFYKKFSDYVTPDLKDYIEIMAVESNQVPAKDAALVISWGEVVKRALEQEKFINTYPDSAKLDDVKQLYEKYLFFALYGLNNTPLFSYDAHSLDLEARAAYSNAIKNGATSEFLQILENYLKLLDKNNNKLTEEVEKYRANISQGLN